MTHSARFVAPAAAKRVFFISPFDGAVRKVLSPFAVYSHDGVPSLYTIAEYDMNWNRPDERSAHSILLSQRMHWRSTRH